MNGLRKVNNWSNGYDFAFSSNNRCDWLRWNKPTADMSQTQHQILLALSLLSEVWAPDKWRVTIDSFTYGFPDEQEFEYVMMPGTVDRPQWALKQLGCRVKQEVAKKRAKVPNQEWGMSAVGPTISGWIRIAMPKGARAQGWLFADEDGFLRQNYEMRCAPEVQGLRSIWLKLCEANSSSDLSLFVREVGEIDLRLTLGATLFNPENEPRATETLVQGVPLRRWQEVNSGLLNGLFEQLKQAGWEHVQE